MNAVQNNHTILRLEVVATITGLVIVPNQMSFISRGSQQQKKRNTELYKDLRLRRGLRDADRRGMADEGKTEPPAAPSSKRKNPRPNPKFSVESCGAAANFFARRGGR